MGYWTISTGSPAFLTIKCNGGTHTKSHENLRRVRSRPMSERYADRDFVEISQGQIGKVIGTKGANGFFCIWKTLPKLIHMEPKKIMVSKFGISRAPPGGFHVKPLGVVVSRRKGGEVYIEFTNQQGTRKRRNNFMLWVPKSTSFINFWVVATQILFMFNPKIGEMIPIWLIFFKFVETTK